MTGQTIQISHFDNQWLSQSLKMMPYEWGRPISRRYRKKYKESGNRAANLDLLAIRELVKGVNMALALDDERVRESARAMAWVMKRKLKKGVEYAREFLHSIGIKLAETKTEAGEIARYVCEYWWRRRLRARHGRTLERAAIQANIVNSKNQIYASDTTVKHRRSQNTRNRAILEEMEAINQDGDKYTLQALAELSISNPKLRRAELMTRIRGFEEYAMSKGHAGEFYTITCPSRMHRTHHKTGQENKKYDGTTPRQAQNYLCGVWARIRSALRRAGIAVYGFRVCEPQHDGCPHWHLLLFMGTEHTEECRAICRRYSLATDGLERGALVHRFTPVAIDPKKGTAAGYIAKYIAKNIDGFAIDQDLFGNDPKKAAERVCAWAARWGIRQFQQIGGPSVTVWRELRRVRSEVGGVIEDARKAADTGDWMQFVKVMGGANVRRDCQAVQLYKSSSLDRETGEIKLNRYQEPAADQIKGVQAGGVVLPTRIHEWKIEKKKEEISSQVLDFDLSGAPAPPWTCVNNCTGLENDKAKSKHYPRKSNAGKEENTKFRIDDPGSVGRDHYH